MQNTVIKGRDNPVIITFSFNGDFAADQLNTFTRIELTIFADTDEVYSTDNTPQQLFIVNGNQLRLVIGDTTALERGNYNYQIIGFSPIYDDGYELHGSKRPIAELGKLRVI